jgi:hypothetical protein
MPPVEITCDAWVSPDCEDCLHAGVGAVRVGSTIQYGVRISGASAYFASPLQLREILLHGFSPCAWFSRQAIWVGEAPQQSFLRPWLDCRMFKHEEIDESFLEYPDDWFSEEDSRIFRWKAKDVFSEGGDIIAFRWILKGLPMDLAPTTFNLAEVVLDPAIAAHCTWLDSRSGISSRC